MKDAAKRIDAELEKGAGVSIVDLVDAIIAFAYASRSSDIHIDPEEDEIRIRLRIDGVLKTTHTLPRTIYNEVISRIKVLATLRTDEHQAAQDGRFRVSLPDDADAEYIDIRVSIIPTYHGENTVLRLLTDTTEHETLAQLGYLPNEEKKILRAIKRPYGMILCTGPTGSGKTTTLYTLMKMLNHDDVSLITIEDPIEYSVRGITQIQTNPQRGLTFASGLRSILRQDPDLVMVGEIRDSETAGIAVNTALTGHLLLSTLHTNDAVTTLPRLLDMGVESYLAASTVNLIIGQRLLRKNCANCAKEIEITEAEKTSLKGVIPESLLAEMKAQKAGKGCKHCNETGFMGRLSINEVLEVNEPVREAILNRVPTAQLKKIAREAGMTPMLEDGCRKVLNGDTTIAEVLRVINE